MTLDDIRRLDPKGMYTWIASFPDQISEATAIGKKVTAPFKGKKITSIVLTGLGGSAIGGDLLRSYLADYIKVPFIVNRNYELPSFVGKGTLVIVSSYSGNTEETISAHKDATKRKASVFLFTTSRGRKQPAGAHKKRRET